LGGRLLRHRDLHPLDDREPFGHSEVQERLS
jgi:hypothetical protein